ncbi:DNA-binding protein [Corallococcus sp. BB11-1]|uniref:DNA-binding protein n=1 Tax=Corallococcus sp. BB11-1 TaxID=2996783 RepID=UPI0022716017|nr:DNA-binding protein [Corallococcus sp. BB11-1]MCY1030725.1 DNA-binding protein [Corallococcus sp. BB11-1]
MPILPFASVARGSFLSRRSALALLGAFALSASACTPAMPIEKARVLGTGEEVTVEGYVSVQPGAFASALGDEGFAVQDSTGGIYVKLEQKQSFGLDARVRITGTLDEQNKLRILKAVPMDVDLLPGTKTVVARDVRTGDVKEPVEGRLVRVSGSFTRPFEDDSPYGYKLYIDDGSGEIQVFVHITAGFDKAALEALVASGASITVTGLAAQYEDTYEVAPRQPSDLVRTSPIP